MKSYMLIVFPIDLIKLNLLSVHVECVRAGQRYFQVYKTTKHVFAIIYTISACACISSLVTMMFQKGAFVARHLHRVPKRRHQ